MKKIILILISILTLFIFIYAHDHRSITQITYVNSIGIEYDQQTDEFTMTFLILNNYTIAQSGNSPTFTNTHSFTATSKGKDIISAENTIRNNSNTKFDLTHIRSLILHDSFFTNNNVIQLYQYIKNNINFNQSFEIYTTKDSIGEIFKLENFSEVSGYYTILVNTQNNIPVKHVRFNDFCNDILIENYTKYYQRIKINEGIINDSNKKYISIDYDGVSFIDNEYKLNSFRYDELNGLAYITTKINRTFPIYYNNKILTFSPNQFKVSTLIKNKQLYIKITINGYFLNNYSYSNQKLQSILIDEIKKDLILMHQTLINYNIDIYNIDYKYSKKFNYKTTKLIYDFNITLTK